MALSRDYADRASLFLSYQASVFPAVLPSPRSFYSPEKDFPKKYGRRNSPGNFGTIIFRPEHGGSEKSFNFRGRNEFKG